MKVVKIFFALIIMGQNAVSGQIIDTCNCKLIYGNWYNPTMVIYHHDSFATYFHSISPKDTVFKMIKGIKEKDTIFNPRFYNWIERNTKTVNNGELGSKINGTFYPKYLSEIQVKIGEQEKPGNILSMTSELTEKKTLLCAAVHVILVREVKNWKIG